MTPTTTTAYRLVATNTGGRVTEDLVIRVKPAPAPSSTDWGKLVNDNLWLIILILLACLAAYGISEWLRHRRWQEEQAAWRENDRNRLEQTPPAPQQVVQPSPVTVNLTVNVNGGAQPSTVTTETAAPQPVATAPEATTTTDSMDGAEAAAGQSANKAGTTTASATELRAEESPATASADGTK
ncbi:MAG: hypothetical protein JNK33_04350 [Candidatus Doudnabacteria bacterium]|nr:hypothetical protein [Candidatus Doudnabacteria bacterium]